MERDFFKIAFRDLFAQKRVVFFGAGFLLLCSIPIIFLAFISYANLYHSETRRVLGEKKAVAFLASATIKEKLKGCIDLGVSLAARKRFTDKIGAKDWTGAMDALEETIRQFPFMERVVLYKPEGVIMADMPKAVPSVIGQSRTDKEWYQGVKKHWEPYVSGIYQRGAEPKINVVTIAIPIKTWPSISPGTPSSKQFLCGIMQIQIGADYFNQWVTSVNAGPEESVCLLDQYGKVLYHPEVNTKNELVDFKAVFGMKDPLLGISDSKIYDSPVRKEKYLMAHQVVPEYGWGIVVAQPERSAFLSRDKALKLQLASSFFLLCLVTVIIFLGLAFFSVLRSEKEKEALTVLAKAKSQFSSTVSHELRSPLASIKEATNLVLEGMAGPVTAEQKDILATAKDNIDRLGRLINNVLVYKKSESGKMEYDLKEMDLNEVVREAHKSAMLFARKRKEDLVIELGGDLPKLKFDRDKILQVLINLMANAIKYGERGGVVTKTRLENSEIHVSVRDSGPGIKPENFEKIFEPFVQLESNPKGGTGLGLAISKEIVLAHRGKIWVESEVGKGSTFHFTFPL